MTNASELNRHAATLGGTLRQLLLAAPDGVFVTAEDNRIVLWNRGAEAIVGHRAADVVGRACREVFGGHGPAQTPRCLAGCAVAPLMSVNGLEQSFDVQTRTRDGDPRWLSVTAFAIVDEAGGGPFVVHVVLDVTSRKHLHRLVRERVGHGRRASAEGAPSSNGRLTTRELEVLRLLAAGVGTVASADRLGVSRATIRNHVQNIFGKLGVHTRLEAVAYATRHRLL